MVSEEMDISSGLFPILQFTSARRAKDKAAARETAQSRALGEASGGGVHMGAREGRVDA